MQPGVELLLRPLWHGQDRWRGRRRGSFGELGQQQFRVASSEGNPVWNCCCAPCGMGKTAGEVGALLLRPMGKTAGEVGASAAFSSPVAWARPLLLLPPVAWARPLAR